MRQIRGVLRLALELSLSRREISRITGVSRDTVTAYLGRAQSAGITWPLPADWDDHTLEEKLFPATDAVPLRRRPEPDWKSIDIDLRKKGGSRQVLHIEYLQEHPDGMSYSLFCDRLREYRGTLKRYLRQDYVAGERVFVDFAGKTMTLHDLKTGARHQAQIFVGVLGASNYIYAEAVWSQKLPDWIMAHVRMFEFFGGAPALVVCDNLKSAVTKADRLLPEIHPVYVDMASHHGADVIAARPEKPQDKAKAEQSVKLVTRWILFRLRKRTYTDLATLNQDIAELLLEVNQRRMQKLEVSRQQLFEVTDKPALRRLPTQRYAYADWHLLRVGLDCHIEVEQHRYSVPYTLGKQEVEARVTADTVEVIYNGRRIASHVRSHVAGAATTAPKHLDPNHRFYATWSQEAALEWAAEVGAPVHAVLKQIFVGIQFKEQGYRPAEALKKLHRVYGAERLIRACERALHVGPAACKAAFVRTVLSNKLDEQPLPPKASETTDEAHAKPAAEHDHPNLRGPAYYH